jgi:hypothetical protein
MSGGGGGRGHSNACYSGKLSLSSVRDDHESLYHMSSSAQPVPPSKSTLSSQLLPSSISSLGIAHEHYPSPLCVVKNSVKSVSSVYTSYLLRASMPNIIAAGI